MKGENSTTEQNYANFYSKISAWLTFALRSNRLKWAQDDTTMHEELALRQMRSFKETVLMTVFIKGFKIKILLVVLVISGVFETI